MSSLVAIAYPDTDTAERVRAELVEATKEHLIQLEDAVVVERRDDGKIKLHQAMSPGAAGAAGGALWGGLIGLIFLAPLLGMAVGAAAGGVSGKLMASSSFSIEPLNAGGSSRRKRQNNAASTERLAISCPSGIPMTPVRSTATKITPSTAAATSSSTEYQTCARACAVFRK